ncbi:MAG: radical SAM-associated putative lipoprotein [Muribaculum sp.]|nr:radical SAM-associated putative lipoprotein [Muribaculum sp.]
MKKVEEKILAVMSRICMVFLALLGFSCSDNGECMYGTPSGSFEAKGIVAHAGGNPVEGAEVKVTLAFANSGEYTLNSTKTDESGRYTIYGDTDGSYALKVVCIPPGNLQPDSVIVDLKYKGKKDGWYKGKASFTADFKLKKKQ